MTGETPEVRFNKREPMLEPYLSINQYISSISSSISISTNRLELAWVALIRSFITDMTTIYTGINAQQFWGAWGGYSEIVRSVRRLCEKVAIGRLQELLSEPTMEQKLNLGCPHCEHFVRISVFTSAQTFIPAFPAELKFNDPFILSVQPYQSFFQSVPQQPWVSGWRNGG